MNPTCPLCAAWDPTSGKAALATLHTVRVDESPFATRWPGALQLSVRRHVVEPIALSPLERQLAEQWVQRLHSALAGCEGVVKVNLVKFGNVAEHLHWHVIPRWQGERHPTLCPWELTQASFDDLHGENKPHFPKENLKKLVENSLQPRHQLTHWALPVCDAEAVLLCKNTDKNVWELPSTLCKIGESWEEILHRLGAPYAPLEEPCLVRVWNPLGELAGFVHVWHASVTPAFHMAFAPNDLPSGELDLEPLSECILEQILESHTTQGSPGDVWLQNVL